MTLPEHYEADVLAYFGEHARELELYGALVRRLAEAVPDTAVKVQKSQISFYGRRLYGAASVPVRRKKGWPPDCLMVTVGLARCEPSPRVTVATEPYPGRWTHHILVTREDEIDAQLLDWLHEAYEFSETKR